MGHAVSNADWYVRLLRHDAVRAEVERVAGPGLLVKSCPRDRGPHAVRIWEPDDVFQWSRRYYAVRVLQCLRDVRSAFGDKAVDLDVLWRAIAVSEML